MRSMTRASRFWRIVRWGAFSLATLIGTGLLLANHLTPPASGARSVSLPVQADATELDRELAPLLAEHPGETGALLVIDGMDAYAARAMSSQKAGRSLDLQYYIWHDDLTGRLLGREVWQAAERGVRVRMLLDDMNAAGKDSKLLLLDSHPNVEIRLYNPFRNRTGVGRIIEMIQRIVSINYRMHNKAWIADGRIAVVGGRNIGEEYFGAGDDVNFRDMDVVLFGPAVAETSKMFDLYWNSEAVVPLAALSRLPKGAFGDLAEDIEAEAKSPHAQRYLARVAASATLRDYLGEKLIPYWSDRVHLVYDPPIKWEDDKQDEWLVHKIERDLASARDKALVISPYFVPGRDFTDAMVAMARKGVTMGVVTNSLATNDVAAVYSAYRPYRDDLVRGGVAVHELRAKGASGSSLFGSSGASLHTKAYSVDDTRGFIGSFNLDARSAYLNTEMGVMFDDVALAKAVRNEYLRLSAPDLSYWMALDENGMPRWLDRVSKPPSLLSKEPDTTGWQRFSAHAISWLPLESQL